MIQHRARIGALSVSAKNDQSSVSLLWSNHPELNLQNMCCFALGLETGGRAGGQVLMNVRIIVDKGRGNCGDKYPGHPPPSPPPPVNFPILWEGF